MTGLWYSAMLYNYRSQYVPIIVLQADNAPVLYLLNTSYSLIPRMCFYHVSRLFNFIFYALALVEQQNFLT